MSIKRASYQRGTLVRIPRKKGPDVWVLRYYQYDIEGNSKRVPEFVADLEECPTRAAAEKKAEEIRKRINDEKACVTFGHLADRYEKEGIPKKPHTRRTYISNLKHLRKRWSKTRIDQMTANIMEIQLWVNNLTDAAGEPYSKQTRQHVRNLLHRIFEDGMLWGILPAQRNPIDLIEVRSGARKKRRSGLLEPDQIDALLADPELASHVKMMIRVAACTGLRASEFLALRWEDIDFHKRTLSILRMVDGKDIGETKSDESEQESYPMHPALSEALRAWKKASIPDGESVPITPWIFGNIQTGRPFHQSTLLQDHLAPAGKRIGIKALGWHSFRHTYRALLSDLEEPLEVQQALMRHSDISMTIEYGKFGSKRAAKLRRANATVVEMISGL